MSDQMTEFTSQEIAIMNDEQKQIYLDYLKRQTTLIDAKIQEIKANQQKQKSHEKTGSGL
jgi:hypothetical protein